MSKDLELTIGKSYVRENTRTAFEVIELRDFKVKYKTYDLTTGELCTPRRECDRSDFVRMVDRAATHAEMADFQIPTPNPARTPDQQAQLNPGLEGLKHLQNINIAR